MSPLFQSKYFKFLGLDLKYFLDITIAHILIWLCGTRGIGAAGSAHDWQS